MKYLATIVCLVLVGCGGGGSDPKSGSAFPAGVWEQQNSNLTARARFEGTDSILAINGNVYELHQFVGGEYTLHAGVVTDGVVVSGSLADVVSTVTVTGDYETGSEMYFTDPDGETFTIDYAYSAPDLNDETREAHNIPIPVTLDGFWSITYTHGGGDVYEINGGNIIDYYSSDIANGALSGWGVTVGTIDSKGHISGRLGERLYRLAMMTRSETGVYTRIVNSLGHDYSRWLEFRGASRSDPGVAALGLPSATSTSPDIRAISP